MLEAAMPADMITQEFLRERFDYCPETGVLTHRVATRKKKIGDIASCRGGHGYLSIYVDGVHMRAHRVIFMWVTGRWPKEIDHINHYKADNRWLNLREVTGSIENCKNRTKSKNNTSGVMGVRFEADRGKWLVRIKTNYRYKNLGRFSDFADAVAAREAAEIQYGFHPNHGS